MNRNAENMLFFLFLSLSACFIHETCLNKRAKCIKSCLIVCFDSVSLSVLLFHLHQRQQHASHTHKHYNIHIHKMRIPYTCPLNSQRIEPFDDANMRQAFLRNCYCGLVNAQFNAFTCVSFGFFDISWTILH